MMPTPSVGIPAPVQLAGGRSLPANPNLEHLKNEAKQRLDALRLKQPATKLAEAQHQLAREYGFAHWRGLKADVERRASGAFAPAAQIALGDWISDGAPSRWALHVRAGEGGDLALTMDTPDFGFFGMAADDVAADGDRLSFALTAPLVVGFHQGLYQARWDAERQRWVGEWTAHGLSTPVDFIRGAWPPAPRFEGIDGFWDGRLERDGGLHRLIFRIKTDAHGTFAWVDSPERNLLGRPCLSVAREGSEVTIAMHAVTFTGQLSPDGQWIEGTIGKGDNPRPLTLARRPPGAAAPLPQRAPVIALSPDALAAFAGRYEGETGLIFLVTVEDGRLWVRFPGGPVRSADGIPRVQMPGGPKLDLLPSAPTKFFWRVLDATVEFELGAEGQVTGLVMRQIGAENRAKRLP
jgi:Domain of unknown function (DUF3471)